MRYVIAMNMKKIIVAIALVAAVIAIGTIGRGPRPAAQPTALAGEATTSTAPQLDRTQEYRMWSAEQMIQHMIVRLSRLTAACNHYQLREYLPKVSETCTESVTSLYPQLKVIRQVAAGGDTVQWANVMDIIRRLEKETEPALQTLGK